MIDEIHKSIPITCERDDLTCLTARLEQAETEAGETQELLQGILNAINSSADAIRNLRHGRKCKICQ